jgi:hypothetical protein
MSRLLDYIKVTATEERKYIQKPLKLVDVKHSSHESYYPDIATMYRVEARLGSQVIVSDNMKAQYGWERILTKKVYEPLAESIFGEFRQPLLDARIAILEGDTTEANKLIDQVLENMFRV